MDHARRVHSDVRKVVFGEPLSANGSEIVWRIIWLITIGIAISYVSYLFFGSLMQTGAEEEKKIVGIDLVKPGEHHISGVVVVPTACHELEVATKQITPSFYELSFTTWQESSRQCTKESATQSFNAIIFAPSVGVRFSATLDGGPIPLELIPHYKP